MSIRVMSWVWAESAADGPDLLVLLAIADQAHDDGGGAWPSVAKLASKARVSERTVQRCIRRLVDLGELEVHPGAGRNGVNVYKVITKTTESRPVSQSPRQPVAPSASPEGVTPVTPRGDTRVTRTVLEPSLPVLIPSSAAADAHTRRLAAAFDEFWAVYPLRKAKAEARRKFDAAVKRGVSAERIIAAATRYRNDPKRSPQFTAHASTWLNQGRWDDEDSAAPQRPDPIAFARS